MEIALIKGDGIGPEITNEVIRILDSAGVGLNYREVIVGERIYLKGNNLGIDQAGIENLKQTPIILKAPSVIPLGGGYRPIIETLKKELDFHSVFSIHQSYYPIIENSPKRMNIVNIYPQKEDLYVSCMGSSMKSTIEEMMLKTCSFAIKYAYEKKLSKVTCFVKDTESKTSGQLLYDKFLESSKLYQDFMIEHYDLSIGLAHFAVRPEVFDVILNENLFGDIFSNMALEMTRTGGLSSYANIGEKYAMFQPFHGANPRMTGKNTANPTALLNAAILMLDYINMSDKAALIKNALLATLEAGYHTKDLYQEGRSKANLGTKEFANSIIDRLGQKPSILELV